MGDGIWKIEDGSRGQWSRSPADLRPLISDLCFPIPPFRHHVVTYNSHRSIISLRRVALSVCVLGYLWFTLINHLRVEWTVNPQYRYGWAVPVLCRCLIWRRRHQKRPQDYGTTGQPDDVVSGQWSVVSGQWSVVGGR